MKQQPKVWWWWALTVSVLVKGTIWYECLLNYWFEIIHLFQHLKTLWHFHKCHINQIQKEQWNKLATIYSFLYSLDFGAISATVLNNIEIEKVPYWIYLPCLWVVLCIYSEMY